MKKLKQTFHCFHKSAFFHILKHKDPISNEKTTSNEKRFGFPEPFMFIAILSVVSFAFWTKSFSFSLKTKLPHYLTTEFLLLIASLPFFSSSSFSHESLVALSMFSFWILFPSKWNLVFPESMKSMKHISFWIPQWVLDGESYSFIFEFLEKRPRGRLSRQLWEKSTSFRCKEWSKKPLGMFLMKFFEKFSDWMFFK